MKKAFNLSIKDPCTQKFGEFESTANGGFCQSCRKEVIDFTRMTESEIITYFKNQTGKVCGRFEQHQMKAYELPPLKSNKPNWKWIGLGAIGIATLLPMNAYSLVRDASKETQASIANSASGSKVDLSGHIVKGKVVDAYDQSPLPGINVVLKGTRHMTVTDINGEFTFPVELEEGDVLIFSFIGLETKEYIVTRSDEYIIDISMVTMTCDIVLMGEVAVEEVYTSKKSLWGKVKDLFR